MRHHCWNARWTRRCCSHARCVLCAPLPFVLLCWRNGEKSLESLGLLLPPSHCRCSGVGEKLLALLWETLLGPLPAGGVPAAAAAAGAGDAGAPSGETACIAVSHQPPSPGCCFPLLAALGAPGVLGAALRGVAAARAAAAAAAAAGDRLLVAAAQPTHPVAAHAAGPDHAPKASAAVATDGLAGCRAAPAACHTPADWCARWCLPHLAADPCARRYPVRPAAAPPCARWCLPHPAADLCARRYPVRPAAAPPCARWCLLRPAADRCAKRCPLHPAADRCTRRCPLRPADGPTALAPLLHQPGGQQCHHRSLIAAAHPQPPPPPTAHRHSLHCTFADLLPTMDVLDTGEHVAPCLDPLLQTPPRTAADTAAAATAAAAAAVAAAGPTPLLTAALCSHPTPGRPLRCDAGDQRWASS
eukprot:1159236-Pelagomonas_calceolata.AAC.1